MIEQYHTAADSQNFSPFCVYKKPSCIRQVHGSGRNSFPGFWFGAKEGIWKDTTSKNSFLDKQVIPWSFLSHQTSLIHLMRSLENSPPSVTVSGEKPIVHVILIHTLSSCTRKGARTKPSCCSGCAMCTHVMQSQGLLHWPLKRKLYI